MKKTIALVALAVLAALASAAMFDYNTPVFYTPAYGGYSGSTNYGAFLDGSSANYYSSTYGNAYGSAYASANSYQPAQGYYYSPYANYYATGSANAQAGNSYYVYGNTPTTYYVQPTPYAGAYGNAYYYGSAASPYATANMQFQGAAGFPQANGAIGTVWHNGGLYADVYEGFGQAPFYQYQAPSPRLTTAYAVQGAFYPVYATTAPTYTSATVYSTPQQFTQPAPAPVAMAGQLRVINMRITHWGGFSPSTIVVNRDETVRILATTDFPSHMHGIVIGSPYNINQRVTSTNPAAPDVIEFTAATRGTFTIYCACGSEHFAAGGMDFTGTLVVN